MEPRLEAFAGRVDELTAINSLVGGTGGAVLVSGAQIRSSESSNSR